MTDEQRKKLFELLRGAVQEWYGPCEARRCSVEDRTTYSDGGDIGGHLLWMLRQLEKNEIEGAEKVARWVGFMQGVLWRGGTHSINDLRNMIIESEGT